MLLQCVVQLANSVLIKRCIFGSKVIAWCCSMQSKATARK